MATIIDIVDYITVLRNEIQKKDSIIQTLQTQLEEINRRKASKN